MSIQSSPVVLSAYDPKGQYLACVTVELDKQRLSVEPTSATQNYSSDDQTFLTFEDSNLRVSSLKWSCLASTETLCVLVGLTNGEIWIYSPLSNEVIYKLSTENSFAIKDIDVLSENLWCVDNNDNIYEFSLSEFKMIQHFQIESCVALNKICLLPSNPSQILVASHSIYLIDIITKELQTTFPGHISPVSILKALSKDYFVSGANDDRFLNIYDINSGLIKTVLVVQSNINAFSNKNQDVIAITTDDGKVEIFEDPIVAVTTKRRGSKTKQATKIIELKSEKQQIIPVFNIFIDRDVLSIIWLQNAVNRNFTQLQWRQLESSYIHEVKLGHGNKNVSADHSLYGQDKAAAKIYVEGNARISSGDNFKHVMDIIKDIEKEDEEKEREGEEGISETLADKLEAISISRLTNKKPKDSKSGIATGTFTVILSQALQANDHSLLETVLNNRDERITKDTIMRLKPTLAVILLERLAERIARQTHRHGPLNVWVKWCLIIHGGYLVTVPNLMSTLSSLHSTLKRRSDLLPRLLALETRLEYALDTVEVEQDEAIEEFEFENQQQINEEDDEEEEVEYNEELDDAGLIDDGEESYSDSDSDEYDSEPEDTKTQKNSQPQSEEENNEEGYSDVEM